MLVSELNSLVGVKVTNRGGTKEFGMDWRDLGIHLCPEGCRPCRIGIAQLTGRELLLCWCKRCGALWFEGPEGMVRLSQKELCRLRQVRASYVTGELCS
jgi:hypothetical protein